MATAAVSDAVQRLAARDTTRSEADLQADVYLLLTAGGLSLRPDQVARLEAPIGDGTRRRLDVEIGHCVIEVKKDLRLSGVLHDAEDQLSGYVTTQTARLESRYVGVLTDGTDWYLYHLHQGKLLQVAHLSLNRQDPDVERLTIWLESILATQDIVQPTPIEIYRRLGADSPAHLLDHATLRALFEAAESIPGVQLKRDLWAKLLRTAFGKTFTDDPSLFIDHTLLVLTAEVIAHAVVGFDISGTGHLTPNALARGTEFAGNSLIDGVVEADFFDWVLEVPTGPEFIAELARRISRFDWPNVDHDVLKVLYESVISQEARASLGEYYTPDWLADQIVATAVTDPLTQRVLDPACGSGTFVFYAIRAYLAAADTAGVPNGKAVTGLTEHVYGMDVHPVAVTLARVTYLLAIGKDRLAAEDRGHITIPIYLGDSLQWEQRTDLLSDEDTITIATAGSDLVEGGGGVLFGDDLIFPRSVLHDAGDFDRLVSAMADRAMDTSNKSSRDLIAPVLRKFGIHDNDVNRLSETFDTMRRLHTTGRNHIWGYYVRNLIRPIWLSEPDHRADVLIGNPPWLRYSKMAQHMQERYKSLARDRGLLSGALGAAGRDLSTLFVTRSVELYLHQDGRFSFVMPHGTMTRKPHHGFRSGRWGAAFDDKLSVSFTDSWDLSKVNTGFPMVSCVIHGARSERAGRMPPTVQTWTGRLNDTNAEWSVARERITLAQGTVGVLSSELLPPASPYKQRFRNGAILYPRMLLLVTQDAAGPLGAGAGRVSVRSRRRTTEKKPWKELPSLQGPIERAFVKDIHLGETILPYRALKPLQAVLPVTSSAILDVREIDDHAALSGWWSQVERLWSAYRVESDHSAFLDRINYHGQLAAQLPTAHHRVVYSASGNTLAAARIDNPDVIIEHKLYWAAVSSLPEARFLTAILNSTMVLERVKPLQALGLFGTRDFDKNVFSVPIPVYDRTNANHQELVALAAEAEDAAAAVVLDPAQDFKKARRVIRDALNISGVTSRIEEVVARIVPEPVVNS
jgi:hypothetical protein